MITLAIDHPTLISKIWPTGQINTVLRNVILVVGGTFLIAVSSKIQVPFYPVPMTMQTLVILLLGMTFGWRLAAITMFLYLGEGAAGLPVFAGTPERGIGFVYMLGGTGGYLVGMTIAAITCGWLAERGWGRNVLTSTISMLLGNLLIYIPGLFWLGTLFGWDKPILEWGLLPFILGDLTKIALGAALLPFAWKLMKKMGN
jgi:biotin transport system substrate-specific component